MTKLLNKVKTAILEFSIDRHNNTKSHATNGELTIVIKSNVLLFKNFTIIKCRFQINKVFFLYIDFNLFSTYHDKYYYIL